MNNDFNNKLPPLPIHLNKAFVIENNNNTYSNNNKKIINLTNGFSNKNVNSNASTNKFIINMLFMLLIILCTCINPKLIFYRLLVTVVYLYNLFLIIKIIKY